MKLSNVALLLPSTHLEYRLFCHSIWNSIWDSCNLISCNACNQTTLKVDLMGISLEQ